MAEEVVGPYLAAARRQVYKLAYPLQWAREKIVAIQPEKKRVWYHRKFRRVPDIDTCWTDDLPCYIEANKQFKRDRRVDSKIVILARRRYVDCCSIEYPNHEEPCEDLRVAFETADVNWFIKYGEIGYYGNVVDAFMKQKHRMIFERRHGPVGSGMRPREEWPNE